MIGEVEITYLHMARPPATPQPPPPEHTLVLQAVEPPPRFYRFLYDGVGDPWKWYQRRRLTDDELLMLIHDPQIEIHVLYHRGNPAGYCELRYSPQETKIEYFGLMPDFIGRGLGKYFLDWTIRAAWVPGTARVWLHTCSLDHPQALPLYQKLGFVPYHREVIFQDLDPP